MGLSIIDMNNLKRAFEIIDKIKREGDLMSVEDISSIAVYAHRDRYYLPLSDKMGSLFLFAIEMNDFSEALFLMNNITISDAEEDIINSLDLAKAEYERLNTLNKTRELYENKNIKAFEDMYNRELLNSEALGKIMEEYPAKKRVLK